MNPLGFARLQDYALSTINEYIEMVSYSLVGFFLPFFLGHPQILVGIVVNSMLIAAALNVRGIKLLPVIVLPSLGALFRGLLFGPFTIFLVYLIPFIWLGNTILVLIFKYLRLHKKWGYASTLVIGAVLKASFLFASALVLFKLSIIPIVFLAAMGYMQAVTAIGGGILAYGLHASKRALSH